MAQLITSEGIALKNILVATDFSPTSVSALAAVVPIARESNSVVHILHVVRPSEIVLALTEDDNDMAQEIPVNAQPQLRPLEDLVGAIPHKIWLREGNVWSSILDLVRSEHIDLIAIGTSGKSDVHKFFEGSIAEQVIRNATCPVLTVGPHVPLNQGVPFGHLLYVMSLWENSHDGLRCAVELAIQHNSRLVLLHVIEKEESKQPDREWLKGFRRIMRNLLPQTVVSLRKEPVLRVEVAKNATARILLVSDEVKADLVVMDVHPKHTFSTHLRDKIYPIISWANCPVLTLRTRIEQATSQQ